MVASTVLIFVQVRSFPTACVDPVHGPFLSKVEISEMRHYWSASQQPHAQGTWNSAIVMPLLKMLDDMICHYSQGRFVFRSLGGGQITCWSWWAPCMAAMHFSSTSVITCAHPVFFTCDHTAVCQCEYFKRRLILY